MESRGHQSRDVRHIDHQERAAFFGDSGEALKIQDARIGAGAGDNQLWLMFRRKRFELIVVNGFSVLAHTVRNDLVHLAGKIQRMPVRQVSAVGQVHAEHGVARLEHGHVNALVGLGAGVRLHVHVFGVKELFCPVDGERFRHVHKLTAAVISLARQAFRVFVGERRAECFKHRLTHKIFRCDQLDGACLPVDFLVNGAGDFRIEFGERSGLGRDG